MKIDKGSEAIMVLAEEVVILLFKFNKAPVVQPFSIKDFTHMMLAENVPSACTLEINAEAEAKLNRSHLILESPSMGLLMRYILEKDYNIELDFTDNVPIRINNKFEDFFFEDLVEQREIAAMEADSGILRSTFDGTCYELEAGGMFGKDVWKSYYCVMSNLGFIKFNENDLLAPPEIMGIQTLNLVSMKGQKRAGRSNLFEVSVMNHKKEVDSRVLSIDDPQVYVKWEKKIKEMLTERKTKKQAMIKPLTQEEEQKLQQMNQVVSTPKGGMKVKKNYFAD